MNPLNTLIIDILKGTGLYLTFDNEKQAKLRNLLERSNRLRFDITASGRRKLKIGATVQNGV